jgi:myo-inositol 2-dehydrogenase/D-chiro-inositol 1-dehydrogenase
MTMDTMSDHSSEAAAEALTETKPFHPNPSDEPPTRYGIIGTGMMGQEHIRNIAFLENAEVVAIAEPDEGMRKAASFLVPDATAVDSLDALLHLDGIDALVIASPNHLHVGQMQDIASRRALPLLVEKPVYTDPSHTAQLAEFAARYPALVWVAMEYRYMPPIASFLSRVHEETGGIKMLSIKEHRFPFLEKVGDWNRFSRNTGGTMVEKCCHFFDLMRLAMQSEPVRVMASAGQAVNHLDETYDGEVPDIWDHGYVIVDFENGARGMLELCMFADGSRYQEEICAVGPQGKIEAFVPGPTRFWPAQLGTPPVAKVIVSPRHPKGPMELDIPVDEDLLEAGDHNGATFYQHQLFLEAIRHGRQPAVSLADGAAAVQMGMAAQESARTGQAVRL